MIATTENAHKEFLKSISKEEKMLLCLRDEFYVGSWGRMIADLRDKLKARPYIFKIVSTIEEDFVRIERLQHYESKHEINISDILERAESASALL